MMADGFGKVIHQMLRGKSRAIPNLPITVMAEVKATLRVKQEDQKRFQSKKQILKNARERWKRLRHWITPTRRSQVSTKQRLEK